MHTDATCRSIHTRCKDQIMGTTETLVKYNGVYPACWGDVRPTREWQQRLFRGESVDHDSPEGRGGEHMILNVWRPISDEPVQNWVLPQPPACPLRKLKPLFCGRSAAARPDRRSRPQPFRVSAC